MMARVRYISQCYEFIFMSHNLGNSLCLVPKESLFQETYKSEESSHMYTLLYKCKLVTCHIQGPTLPRIEFHAYLVKDLRRNGRDTLQQSMGLFHQVLVHFLFVVIGQSQFHGVLHPFLKRSLVQLNWRETTIT